MGRSSNIAFDPRCYNISYSGTGTGIWKTEDDGGSFTLLHDFGITVTEIRVAWTDPDVIYACTYGGSNNRIWRTTDAGSNWTEVTPSAGVGIHYDIAVSGTNAQTLWAARVVAYTSHGELNGNKVFKSTDGGTTWTNITDANLDGEYLSNIVHQRGSNGGVYVGTRRGVYYKNNSMANWALFNNNLPAKTVSTKLVPNYYQGKLINGTNRSAYAVDLYEDNAPVAQIAAHKLDLPCVGEPVQFVDHSSVRAGATYAWQFLGGTPATSSAQNPIVNYALPGSYDVTLTVTDVFGSNSQTINNLITIGVECEPDTILGSALQCLSAGDYVNIPDLGIAATNTFTITAWVKPFGIQSNYTSIV
ncbi:MAG: PKD domain-containing protein, partial [Methylococcales bacterium]|nr:PKD domain-containing protein [Methylococcales bacterium]